MGQPNEPDYEQIAKNVQRRQQVYNQATFNKRPIKCLACGGTLFHPPIVAEVWKEKHHIIGKATQVAMIQKPNNQKLYCLQCGKALEAHQIDDSATPNKEEKSSDKSNQNTVAINEDGNEIPTQSTEQKPNENTKDIPNMHEQSPKKDNEDLPNTSENTENNL